MASCAACWRSRPRSRRGARRDAQARAGAGIAHGTNPATAAFCGFTVDESRAPTAASTSAVKAKLGPDVAAIMLTNPNTCGLFEREIIEIAEASMRRARTSIATAPTSTPSSARCARAISASMPCTSTCTRPSRRRMAAAVRARARWCCRRAGAVRAVPVRARRRRWLRCVEDTWRRHASLRPHVRLPRPDGHVHRALDLHPQPWQRWPAPGAEDAVLNANYILARLKDHLSAPFGDGRACTRRCSTTMAEGHRASTTLDFAKALIDEGYHPMTMYFPLVVHGAMLIEPTETESGEHIIHFAERFPALEWQASDPDSVARRSISAWAEEAALSNILLPVDLDASAEEWPTSAASAILCINMTHIAPWAATLGLLKGAARLLRPGAPLILYGPFLRADIETAPSNAAFDAQLRARNPAYGIRWVEDVDRAAEPLSLARTACYPMPANNLVLVYRLS
jgi:hypothetical protein